ncbi:TPA: hypothetical protein DCQ85_02115 [Candidatus Magasanikbacteria bacterium]|nr:hypothetical protein [Candidatus Magasanikbacteria bacterium]
MFEEVRFTSAGFACKKNVSITVFEQVDDFSFLFIQVKVVWGFNTGKFLAFASFPGSFFEKSLESRGFF